MKKYTLINNETGYTNSYSSFVWNLTWIMVFIAGLCIGLIL